MPRSISSAQALLIGDAVGVDWSRTSPDAFARALEREAAQLPAEEEDDEVLAGRLAWERLAHTVPARMGQRST